jgi:hypothetical protein
MSPSPEQWFERMREAIAHPEKIDDLANPEKETGSKKKEEPEPEKEIPPVNRLERFFKKNSQPPLDHRREWEKKQEDDEERRTQYR